MRTATTLLFTLFLSLFGAAQSWPVHVINQELGSNSNGPFNSIPCDYNADGLDDYIIPDNDVVRMYFGGSEEYLYQFSFELAGVFNMCVPYDLEGDGILEVAIFSNSNTLQFCSISAESGFTELMTFSFPDLDYLNPLLLCPDIDGDVLPDLITSNVSEGVIRCQFSSNNYVEFNLPATLDSDVDLKDLNGDGYLEVFVTSTQSNTAEVYNFSGSLNYTYELLATPDFENYHSRYIATGQMDNDSETEVVALLTYPELPSLIKIFSHYDNDDPITLPAGDALQIIVADYNSDGFQDILIPTMVYLGGIDGFSETNFIEGLTFPNELFTPWYSLLLDYVVYTAPIENSLNTRVHSWSDEGYPITFEIGNSEVISTSIEPINYFVILNEVRSLTNNEDLQLITYGAESLYISPYTAGQATAQQYNMGVDAFPPSDHLGQNNNVYDLNGNGNAELFVLGNDGVIYGIEYNGENSQTYFVAQTNVNPAADLGATYLFHDIMGDDAPELIYGDGNTAEIKVFMFDYNSISEFIIFEEFYAYSSFSLVNAVGDNDPDIVVYANNSVQFFVYNALLENTNGVFSLMSYENIPIPVNEIIPADFNSDGFVDLLVKDDNYEYQILYKNSDGTYQDGLLINPLVSEDFSSSQLIGVAEINGDMWLDLVMMSMNEIKVVHGTAGGFSSTETVGENVNYGIQYMLADMDLDHDLDIYHAAGISRWLENPSNSSNQVQIRYFTDWNGNGTKESSEEWMSTMTCSIPGVNASYQFQNGINTFYVEDGNYTIVANTAQNLWSSGNSQVIEVVQGDFEFNIGLVPLGSATHATLNSFNTPFICTNALTWYGEILNNGNTPLNGSWCITPSAEFVVSNLSPDMTFDGTSYCINVANLSPGNEQQCFLQFDTVSFEFLNTPFSISAEFVGDINVADTDNLELLCAYDPNDITENTGYTSVGYFLPENTLDYVIRFQNTGNYPAANVDVVLPLSDQLIHSSLQVLGSTHEYYYVVENGTATFHFPNIQLPDSTSDFEGSIGVIHFQIHALSNLALGETIEEQAAIYFDLNPAVYTNVEVNTAYDCGDLITASFDQEFYCANSEVQITHEGIWVESLEWTQGQYNSNSNPFIAPSNTESISMSASNALCSVNLNFDIPQAFSDYTFLVDGNALFTDYPGLTHQWYLGNNPIQGAMESTYDITESGLYSVVITTEDGCFINSTSQYIDYIGLEEAQASPLLLFPNPTQAAVYFQQPVDSYTLYNYQGAIVAKETNRSALIDLSHFTAGIYFIESPQGRAIIVKE